MDEQQRDGESRRVDERPWTREAFVSDEIKRATGGNLLAWVKAVGTPALTIVVGLASGYVGVELRLRGMESRIDANTQGLSSARALDHDGFRDPGMRAGIDRQIRAALRDPDFFSSLQFKLERAYTIQPR